MIKKVFSFIYAIALGLCSTIIPVNTDSYYCDDYSGFGTGGVTHTEVINYDSYTMTDVHLDNLFPIYMSSYGTNACASTAGSMLVTYHDITYTNLLPNYNPGSIVNGTYKYRTQNSTINNLMIELYNLMGTNTINPGTSVNQFKSGLSTYYSNHNYNISFTKLSNNLDSNTVTTYLEQEKPLILFLNSYDYYVGFGVTISDTSMTMEGIYKEVGHVVVAYGYRVYNFYEDGNLFRTDRYLIVSFGDGTTGYLSTNDTSYIDEVYVTSVN